jgi:short-subunit dehydrogenase
MTTALVTGASSGIGEEFARQLAAGGSNLVVVARDKVRLDLLAADLRRRYGVRVEVIAADLREPAEVEAVERRLTSTVAPVDLLVGNAGYADDGGFRDLELDDALGQVELYVSATLRLTHTAVRAMADRAGGGIITVASTGAFAPVPGRAVSTATKAFVVSLSESLHREVRAYGVTVTCVCPGYTRTEPPRRAGVARTHVPRAMWQTPSQVVRAALDGHARGRAVVVPGLLNRVLVLAARFAPRGLGAAVAARLVAPGRRH